MQVAMCYNLLAGYPQTHQKKMIHMAAALACAADLGSAVRRQRTWFIPCLAELRRGSSRDCTQGWAALTRPSIASGAPNFYGGLKVLASLQVILGQFLHEEAGGWFPSLRLPPPNELLTMLAVCNPNYPMLFRYFIAHDNSMTTRSMPCATFWNLRECKKALERSACLAAWQLATRP